MKKLLTAVTSILCWAGLVRAESPLEIGAEAPRVSGVVDQDNNPVDLGAAYDAGPVLVFFYPKAGTPGCTAQACSLRDEYSDLTEAGLKVFGVSADKPAAQKKFAENQNLPFTLIADTEAKVINAFGVPKLGKGNIPKRQAYLIKDGKIVWRDLSASTKKQAEDVLAVIGGWE